MKDKRNEKILDLTQRLIRIQSTKDNLDALCQTLDLVKTELSDYSYQEFSKKDLKVNSISSILFFNKKNRPDKFRILLQGHLDVVPAQDGDQFKPFIKDNRLYGRGALDMKSGVAVLISVFNDLTAKIKYPVGLSLTVDEETTSLGAKNQVEKGVKADFVISGEPTNLEIGNQHKGILSLELFANTQGGHTAYDGDKRNALLQVLQTQSQATKMYPGPDGRWRTTCSPTVTTTNNQANNIVPSYATGKLSIRWVPQDNPDVIQSNISKINPQVIVKRFYFGEAHLTNPNNPDIMLLAKTIESVVKKPAVVSPIPHSSDLIQWTTAGADGIDFGPCGIGLHSKDEYVEIESLGQYAEIIKLFLLSVRP